MPATRKIIDALARAFLPRTAAGRRARADRHRNRATRLYREGSYAESEKEFLKAIEVAREPGSGVEFLATTLDQIGDFYHSTGNYSRAEPLYRKSLELRKQHAGDNNEKTHSAINNLALLYYAEGRYEEAEPLYKTLIELLGKGRGLNTPEMATCLENYAAVLRRLSRNSESDELRSQARSIRQALQRTR